MVETDQHRLTLLHSLFADVSDSDDELVAPQDKYDLALFPLKVELAVAVDRTLADMRDRPDLYFYAYDREIIILPRRREVRVALTLLGNADGTAQVLRRDLARRKENAPLNECVELWRAVVTDCLSLPDGWDCEVKFHGYG